jgi:hypothetical protein
VQSSIKIGKPFSLSRPFLSVDLRDPLIYQIFGMVITHIISSFKVEISSKNKKIPFRFTRAREKRNNNKKKMSTNFGQPVFSWTTQ